VNRDCPTFVRLLLWMALPLYFSSCEQADPNASGKPKGHSLSKLLIDEEYWEGTSTEFKEGFFTNDEFLFCKVETKRPYSGIIKIRSRTGIVSASYSYAMGSEDGDFFEWHDNGRLKSKSQYKEGMRHGYFYIWTNTGEIYSRKYYKENYQDFDFFPDEGPVESGRSLEAIQLEKWEGKGTEFYQLFAGDPKRGGMLYIRSNEEPYTGTITALDDRGNKEAVLRFKNGKYHGTISKWNENGMLWEEGEFDRGQLVQFSIMEGKPFDSKEIIDITDPSDEAMIQLLFNE
jgi:antitoxin component YwqK of YwqJK toxin-antitoxin module